MGKKTTKGEKGEEMQKLDRKSTETKKSGKDKLS